MNQTQRKQLSSLKGQPAVPVQIAFYLKFEAAAILQQVVSSATDKVRRKDDVRGLSVISNVPQARRETLRSKDVHLLQVQSHAVQQACCTKEHHQVRFVL